MASKWGNPASIECNEIATVLHISALAKKKVIKDSNHSSKKELYKKIALLCAVPHYGFFQKIYNLNKPVSKNKSDSTTDFNFHSYYGRQDSLVRMERICSIPAIANPADYIYGDTNDNFEDVRLDDDSGLLLSKNGDLLTSFKDDPPFLKTLYNDPYSQITNSIASRSVFNHEINTQVVDDVVEINLATGTSKHIIAGEFVDFQIDIQENGISITIPPNLSRSSPFMAFRDEDGVVRIYSKNDFRNPIFLAKNNKFYSAKNPNRELRFLTHDEKKKMNFSDGKNILAATESDGTVSELVILQYFIVQDKVELLSFDLNKQSGHLELYKNGQKTDRYLIPNHVAQPYFSFLEYKYSGSKEQQKSEPILSDIIFTGSENNPSEIAFFECGKDDIYKITLPNKENDPVIFG
jgi:hypothetical protein